MKDQVKAWIADKGLTADSYDGIMIGVIYNSGHNTLDDPDVRKWIETHPNEFRLMLPPKLTDDQQVVLEWLKKSCTADNYTTPMLAIYKLYSSQRMAPNLVLTAEQQFQVLAAFAEWGLEEMED